MRLYKHNRLLYSVLLPLNIFSLKLHSLGAAVVAQQVKPLPVVLQFSTGPSLIHGCFSSDPVPAYGFEKAVEDSPRVWASFTHVADPDKAHVSQLQPGPDLPIVTVWAITVNGESLFLFLPLCN